MSSSIKQSFSERRDLRSFGKRFEVSRRKIESKQRVFFWRLTCHGSIDAPNVGQ